MAFRFLGWSFLSCLLLPLSVQKTYAMKDTIDFPTALLVDKKKNVLHVCKWNEWTEENEKGEKNYQILKSYHVTLGQVKGDKESEDDLKTPEGVYLFKTFLKPPFLQKKFGSMSFLMDFPNPFDSLAGHTGSGIMLHGTNEPERLKKKYDSEGCVVLENSEIKEIRPYIRLSLTPILIFSDFSDQHIFLQRDLKLEKFFFYWISNWEKKKIDPYIAAYHSAFFTQGMNRSAWRNYKHRLNQIYDRIQVEPKNIFFYRHPKYSLITFTQNYNSILKSGRRGYQSFGTKILYIAEEGGGLKIIAEKFVNTRW